MLTDEQVAEIVETTYPCEWETDYDPCNPTCALCLKRSTCALLTDRAELVAEVGRLESENRMLLGARRDPADVKRIAALEAEVSELLPMADVAGWWQGEFQMANVDRNELRAENERLRSTLAAKETVQRANEDEMSADNERLRDALLGIVGLPDVHAKELEIAVDALAALDEEVGE